MVSKLFSGEKRVHLQVACLHRTEQCLTKLPARFLLKCLSIWWGCVERTITQTLSINCRVFFLLLFFKILFSGRPVYHIVVCVCLFLHSTSLRCSIWQWDLHCVSFLHQVTLSEPSILGGTSQFQAEPVEGRRVSKVIKTTMVHGERMEKHLGDSSLATDLPSAKDDFEEVWNHLHLVCVFYVCIMFEKNMCYHCVSPCMYSRKGAEYFKRGYSCLNKLFGEVVRPQPVALIGVSVRAFQNLDDQLHFSWVRIRSLARSDILLKRPWRTCTPT